MLLLSVVILTAARSAAASDRREVRPGLVYEHRVLDTPLSIHILEVDPAQFEIFPARALNNGLGREAVSSIATRKGALAAINGGFFRIGGRYDGDPSGVLKIDGSWYSDTALNRGAIGWSRDGKHVVIGRVEAGCSLEIGSTRYPVNGLNRSRGRREAILYNSAFHRTSLTNPSGTEIIISGGRVSGVHSGGDSPIPPDGYVYSLGADAKASPADGLQPGAPALVRCNVATEPSSSAAAWEPLAHVVGGTPVLVLDGALVGAFEQEQVRRSFIDQRHPRTAVGVLPNGNWLLVVVDGRQPEVSVGMKLAELAQFMLNLGCRKALNLDGGGSSAFYLEGEIRNKPSDLGVERPVSDAILIKPRGQ